MSIFKPNLEQQISAFINQAEYPCVGAKTALNKGKITVKQYDDLRCDINDTEILTDIYNFIHRFELEKDMYSSLVLTFEQPEVLSEVAFDNLLWQKLQQLHDIDTCMHDWDKHVDDNPHSPNFSFSLGGKAFFIIGLHPGAKRKSRRFERPTLVFNLHEQFDLLREQGKFEGLRDHIRQQDETFCGSKNTLLKNHGEKSEAYQYSGKQQSEHWQCPFHASQN
jgi:FPC/CPF motif-containing protein YcgG